MAVVTRARLIAGTASLESDWLDWLQTAEVPVWPWVRYLAPAVRLVVLAPHPDDELLMCGGLLAQHAQAGGECLIVGVTDGEASHGGSPAGGLRRLALARACEREQGLARLGLPYAEVRRLGLPDGKLGQHRQALMALLSALLRPDDLVLSTWRLDGHPDHDTVGDCAAQICRDMGCRLVEAPVWMWHWAAPGDDRVPWQRLVCIHPDPRVLRRKQEALQAHISQLEPRGAGMGPVLDDAIVARSRRAAEYFFL
jgi:LmbE family N-acetylglucosaminyl deacetylase